MQKLVIPQFSVMPKQLLGSCEDTELIQQSSTTFEDPESWFIQCMLFTA